MKRLLSVTFLSVLLLCFTLPLLAQEGEEVEPGNLTDYVQTFAIFCSTCVLVAAFVIKALSTKWILVGWVKYIVAALTSLVLGFVSYLLKLGIFDVAIGEALMYMLGGFLMAAGLFKFPIVEAILDLFKLIPKKSSS